MWEKFALTFDMVDRGETVALRRRMGMDANPWRAFSRIIATYHYLRQDDVLEQFLAASNPPEGSPHLPWDLLIVDECHNLMPSAFGEDSDLRRWGLKLAERGGKTILEAEGRSGGGEDAGRSPAPPVGHR